MPITSSFSGLMRLDDKLAGMIRAYPFHRSSNEAGNTFDDTHAKRIASPLGEMRGPIEPEPRNQEVVFPYIGGEYLNASPTQAHQRHVINLGARPEDECRSCWPDLMAIVESKVKPARMKVKRGADGCDGPARPALGGRPTGRYRR